MIYTFGEGHKAVAPFHFAVKKAKFLKMWSFVSSILRAIEAFSLVVLKTKDGFWVAVSVIKHLAILCCWELTHDYNGIMVNAIESPLYCCIHASSHCQNTPDVSCAHNSNCGYLRSPCKISLDASLCSF